VSPSPHLEALAAFLLFMLANQAWRTVRSPRTRVMLRGLRAGVFARGAATFVAVVAAALVLHDVHPALNWTWLSYLMDEPVTGSLVTGQALASTRVAAGPMVTIAPYLFPVLLLTAMPRLAWYEERLFRRGAERRGTTGLLLGPLAFGLAHLVMGVPVFAALALSVAGAVFQRDYLRAYERSGGSRLSAVHASSSLHLAYNVNILVLMAVALGLRELIVAYPPA
jgi:hypothetical protein